MSKIFFVTALTLITLSTFSVSAFEFSDTDQENFMICNVSISKAGKTLSKHLITTYHPQKGIIQIGDTSYHFAATMAGNCVLQPFEKDYNKKNLHFDKKKGKYVDLCYKIANGVTKDKDGYAEFYINLRSDKEFYEMNYLNESNPVKVKGTQDLVKKVGDYEVSASCENQMLSPVDPIWTMIKQQRLGDYDNTKP